MHDYTDTFLSLWSRWHKSSNPSKGRAFKNYKKLLKHLPEPELIDACDAYIAKRSKELAEGSPAKDNKSLANFLGEDATYENYLVQPIQEDMWRVPAGYENTGLRAALVDDMVHWSDGFTHPVGKIRQGKQQRAL